MKEEVKVLYVEDDEALGFITKDELELVGYQVIHAKDGEEAINQFNENHFDIAILDIMLPKKDGFSVAQAIRSKNEEMPIIFLSAKTLEEDRLKGFELGADDYLTKPFSMDELLFKLKIFLKRRSLSNPSIKENYQIGKFILEPNNLHLESEEHKFELTAKESDLLLMLVENKNNTVKREDILVKLWGKNDYFLGRSLDVFISRLRKYLTDDTTVEIQTVRGVGFKLIVE